MFDWVALYGLTLVGFFASWVLWHWPFTALLVAKASFQQLREGLCSCFRHCDSALSAFLDATKAPTSSNGGISLAGDTSKHYKHVYGKEGFTNCLHDSLADITEFLENVYNSSQATSSEQQRTRPHHCCDAAQVLDITQHLRTILSKADASRVPGLGGLESCASGMA